MEIGRRRFLQCLTGVIAAPAIIRVADIMPIRSFASPLIRPNYEFFEWGQGSFAEHLKITGRDTWGNEKIKIIPRYDYDLVAELRCKHWHQYYESIKVTTCP